MPGNKEGGEKIKQMGIQKYGSYEGYRAAMKEMASKGGKKRVVKGFAVSGLARTAGSLGGRVTLQNRLYKLSQENERAGIKLTRDK